MNQKTPRLALILAAVLVGVVIGYTSSEAARSGSALVQVPTAEAAEVQAARPAVPETDKSQKKVRRFGQVIGLKPERQTIYDMLHAHPWKPINRLIRQCHIQNYSIYETELDGKLYLFAYFEYTGDDFDGDMARMAKDQTMQAWWKLTDPCQIRLPGTPEGKQWKEIPQVYHLD